MINGYFSLTARAIAICMVAVLTLMGTALSDSGNNINSSPKLVLNKSVSPSNITMDDTTTIIIRVENTGSDVKSVKITDTIPEGFNLVSGSTSQEYSTLKTTESRIFQYTMKATSAGQFVIDPAKETYEDDKGIPYTGYSNKVNITVQIQPKTPAFEGITALVSLISVLLILKLRRFR